MNIGPRCTVTGGGGTACAACELNAATAPMPASGGGFPGQQFLSATSFDSACGLRPYFGSLEGKRFNLFRESGAKNRKRIVVARSVKQLRPTRSAAAATLHTASFCIISW